MHRASASSVNTKTPSESDTSSLNSIEMTEAAAAAAAAAAMTGAAPSGPTRRHSSALLVNGKMGGAAAGPAVVPAPPTGEFYKRTSAPNLALPAGIPFDPDCQVMISVLITLYSGNTGSHYDFQNFLSVRQYQFH